MIPLQLRARDGSPRFAVLIEPSMTLITNDDQLYSEVQRNNGAIIQQYDGCTFSLQGSQETVDPTDFERDWQGD